MRVWDLAENAYPRRNPWLSWLRWSTGADVPFILENENPARCFVGLRMVKAPADGVIERLPRGHVDHPGLIRWAYLKEEGDTVVAEPRRREDFVGYVMLRAFDYEELCVELRRTAEFIAGGVGVMRSAVLGGVST
jgi:hypothetical protein